MEIATLGNPAMMKKPYTRFYIHYLDILEMEEILDKNQIPFFAIEMKVSQMELEPARVRYCQVANKDKLNHLFDSTGSFYRQAIEADLTKRQIEPVFVQVKNYSDFNEIDSAYIADICEKHELDGFVLGKLRFVFISYSLTLIPIGQSQDTEVEMQYFGNNGKLLIHTSHNTYNGNSYPEMPIATKTVRDGAKGAIKKIFKEMKRC